MSGQARVAPFCRPSADPRFEEFGLRTYLAMIQAHLLRGRQQDLNCVQTVGQSIAGLAPDARLFETAKRIRALLLFVRTILSRDGSATDEERAILQRAFDRLIAAAIEEGALDEF